jgi:hypothetical protein
MCEINDEFAIAAGFCASRRMVDRPGWAFSHKTEANMER